MIRSIEGVYREGKVELLEPAPVVASETRVIVTFLTSGHEVNLSERGMGPEQAADLRSRLKSFESDWQQPEMDAYDAL